MGAVGQVKLRIKDGNGQVRGQLIVKILPQTGGRGGGTLAPLVDETDNPDRDPFHEPVQLLEGEEYLYRIVCFEPATWSPPIKRVFHPDNATGKRVVFVRGCIRAPLRSASSSAIMNWERFF